MSSKSKGSSEQRDVKDALASRGGSVEGPTWSAIRTTLDLRHMNTAVLQATSRVLNQTGEVEHRIVEGSITLQLA